MVPALTGALQSFGGEFTITGDPSLTPLEAQIHWNDGFDHVDLGHTLQEISRALELFDPARPDSAAKEETRHHAG